MVSCVQHVMMRLLHVRVCGSIVVHWPPVRPVMVQTHHWTQPEEEGSEGTQKKIKRGTILNLQINCEFIPECENLFP